MYNIVRYIANKPADYNEEPLQAKPSIQYRREDKCQAEQILNKLYEITTNQKNMIINKRTRYTFRCENKLHKYFFKVEKETKNEELKEIYL